MTNQPPGSGWPKVNGEGLWIFVCPECGSVGNAESFCTGHSPMFAPPMRDPIEVLPRTLTTEQIEEAVLDLDSRIIRPRAVLDPLNEQAYIDGLRGHVRAVAKRLGHTLPGDEDG